MMRAALSGNAVPTLPLSMEAGSVHSREQRNIVRNKHIAANEAKREFFSEVRVSTWAIAITIVIGAVALLLYLE